MAASLSGGSGEQPTPPSLQQLFLSGWETRRRLEACEVTAKSPEYSACVAEGVAALERATELANHASLFSDNEDLDEVPTSSLKYLLLPALLGELTLLQTEGERMDIVLRARVYFVDYLKRCRSYGITKEDPPPAEPQLMPPSMGVASEQRRKPYEQLAAERAARVQKYKEKRELERRTENLTALLNSRERASEEEEEEGKREDWVAMLQLSVYRSRDFVKSVEEEIPILRHMEAVRRGEEPVAKKPEPVRNPAKPIVITREMLQGKVFGAGYPSVPTMSVEEFYQQRYGDQQAEREAAEVKKTEKEEEEKDEDDDDSEEAVRKARQWDDFKDDNRRGSGNRKNMG